MPLQRLCQLYSQDISLQSPTIGSSSPVPRCHGRSETHHDLHKPFTHKSFQRIFPSLV